MTLRGFAALLIAGVVLSVASPSLAQPAGCNVTGRTIESQSGANCSSLPTKFRFSLRATCIYGCNLPNAGEAASETEELTQQCFPKCNVDRIFNARALWDARAGQWSMTTQYRKYYSTGCSLREHKNVTITCSQCPTCGTPGGGGTGTGGGENPDLPDPLLISLADAHYPLSSHHEGVKFDLDLDGEPERTAWTLAKSDEAFLVLDRNGNGQIDDGTEVFGDRTPQLPSDDPNGFRALEVFDDTFNGGNGDGRIDAADAIYVSLKLWTDSNHDGRSAQEEMSGLEGLVTAIDLDYQRSSHYDEHGHEFRYWTNIDRPDGSQGATIAWNVFFAKPPATTRN